MLEKLFKLRENDTTVKTEVIAGLTTFMTMAYILAVNPSMLNAAGMDTNAALIATALAAFIGTLAMAFLANYPFALASGMGLNAYFAYTVCGSMGYSWQVALLAVFAEGIVFIALSLTNVREAIFNAIPLTLKHGVSAEVSSQCRYRTFHRFRWTAWCAPCCQQRFHSYYNSRFRREFPHRRNLCRTGNRWIVHYHRTLYQRIQGCDSDRYYRHLDSRYDHAGCRCLPGRCRRRILLPLPEPCFC